MPLPPPQSRPQSPSSFKPSGSGDENALPLSAQFKAVHVLHGKLKYKKEFILCFNHGRKEDAKVTKPFASALKKNVSYRTLSCSDF